MPTLTDVRTVALNAKVDNVLAGKVYEFMPFDGEVRFGLVAAAAGLRATVISGSDVLQDDQEVSDANRTPIDPDDFALTDVAGAGERLVVALRNTTGAGILVRTVVKIEAV
jgi:hypothetical protein